jgi:hypothetical protein
MNEDVELLLAERAIQRVLTTYSRGVDRYDFDLVRSCYWPEGTDDHGSFVGGVDDFIAFVERSLNRCERTCHFLGNMLIDVDLSHDVARSETYAVAFHRYTDPDGYPTDMWGRAAICRPLRTPRRSVADSTPSLRLRVAPHRSR